MQVILFAVVLFLRISQTLTKVWPAGSIITQTGGAASTPITIYTSLALDSCSKYSNYGKAMRQNYEMLIDWISANRGGVRVNGTLRPLQVVMYNDFSDKDRVREIYHDLVHNQHHRLFLSTYSSGLSEISASIVNETDALMLAPCSAKPSVFKGRPNVFSTLTPSDQYMIGPFQVPAKFAKTMVYVHEAAGFTTTMCEGLPSLANQSNVTILNSSVLPSPPSQQDVQRLLGAMKHSPPDLLVGCVYQAACKFFYEEIAALQIDFKAIIMSLCTSEDFDALGKARTDAAIGLTPWLPDFALVSDVTGRSATQFTADYQSKYNEAPNYQGVSAQMSLLSFVQAIEATNSTDPGKIAAHLRIMNMKTIFGTISFDQNGQGQNPFKGVQVSFSGVTQRSVLSIVSPQDVAVKNLTYPMPTAMERKCVSQYTWNPYGFKNGSCIQCGAGEESLWSSADNQRKCIPCRAGYRKISQYNAVSQETVQVCSACPMGNYNGVVGKGECTDCLPGRFTNTTGSPACSDCTPGHISRGLRSTQCEVCALGKFAGAAGMSQCIDCPAGNFSDSAGSHYCKSCPHNKITWLWSTSLGKWIPFAGSRSPHDCGCRENTQPDNNGGCIPCGKGLDCRGNGIVLVERHYAWDERFSTYRCRPDPDQCPGGPRGTCAAGRLNTSIGCSRCEEGKKPEGNGTCGDCGMEWIWAILVVALLVAVLIAIYVFNASGDAFSTSPAVMQVAVTMGQMLAMIQNLCIVGLISIEWPLKLQRVFEVLQVFNFDVAMLRPECFTSAAVVVQYVSRLLLIFLSLLVLFILHFFATIKFHRCEFRNRNFALVGSCGTLMMMFFISVVTTVLAPLQCVGHPNHEFTMRSYPYVKCDFDSDHKRMVIIGVIATSMPITYVAVITMVIVVLPTRMSLGDTTFLKTWSFMLVRFLPGMYYFSPLFLVRNALLSIASVFTNAVVQIFWLDIVLFLSVVTTILWLPWRVWQGNVSDIGISSSLLFIVISAGFFVEQEEQAGLTDVMLGLMIFTLSAVPVAMVAFVVHWLLHRRGRFEFFLCHHKLAAGASARCFKQLLTKRVNGPSRRIFIDSDDLKNLTQLFDVVAHETQTLVVLHTSEVLKRPWCMGEIAIATKKQVPIVIIMFPGCALPAAEFIYNYEKHVPDIKALCDYAINVTMVQDALQRLAGKPCVALPDQLSKTVLQNACKHLLTFRPSQSTDGENEQDRQIFVSDSTIEKPRKKYNPSHQLSTRSRHLSRSNSKRSTTSSESGKTNPDASVVIIADSANWEAVSSAIVLHEFMMQHLYQAQDKLPVVLRSGDSIKKNVSDMVLICTTGMWHRTELCEWLLQAAAVNSTALPILCDVNFTVPSVSSIHSTSGQNSIHSTSGQLKMQNVSSLKEGSYHAVGCTRRAHDIQHIVLAIFQEIGIVFQCSDAAGTEDTLKVKGREVARRLCMPARARLQLPDTTGCEDTGVDSAGTGSYIEGDDAMSGSKHVVTFEETDLTLEETEQIAHI